MTKQVALADDVYEMVDRLRQPGESLSDVIRRCTEETRKKVLLSTFGAWKGLGDPEAQRIDDEIRKSRKTGKFRKPVEF